MFNNSNYAQNLQSRTIMGVHALDSLSSENVNDPCPGLRSLRMDCTPTCVAIILAVAMPPDCSCCTRLTTKEELQLAEVSHQSSSTPSPIIYPRYVDMSLPAAPFDAWIDRLHSSSSGDIIILPLRSLHKLYAVTNDHGS